METVCIFIVPTCAEATPPEDAQWFYKWLEDSVNDFRVTKTLLKDLRFAVFGLGNSLYAENYNVIGKNMDTWLGSLGAQRFAPLGLGDENVAESLNGSLEADFDHWTEGLLHLLKDDDEQVGETKKKSGGCGSGKDCCSKKKKKVLNKKGLKTRIVEEYDVTVDSDSDSGEPVVDLEDLGSSLVKREAVNGEEESGDEEGTSGDGEVREMLTPLLRESLTKQGYRLIGSHSGVKLCRWTKVFFFDLSFYNFLIQN